VLHPARAYSDPVYRAAGQPGEPDWAGFGFPGAGLQRHFYPSPVAAQEKYALPVRAPVWACFPGREPLPGLAQALKEDAPLVWPEQEQLQILLRAVWGCRLPVYPNVS
jgi:hypothetical protein